MHKTRLALIGICGAASLGLSPLGAHAAPAPRMTQTMAAVARNQSHRTLPTGVAGGDTVSAIATCMARPIAATATIPPAAPAATTAPTCPKPIPSVRAAGGRKWTARIAPVAAVGAEACVQVADGGSFRFRML